MAIVKQEKRNYEIAVLSLGAYARTVRIYAPKKADHAVIMHDGQNVFRDCDAAFGKSWRAVDILRGARIKNTAVIGVDCASTRDDDYLPFPTELASYGVPVSGGKADAYVEYLAKTVIPYLDKRFGFKMYAMLGSSAGASATLHYAAQKDARIKAYGMYSTPLFVSPVAYEKFFKTASFDDKAFYHVYAGGSEDTGTFKDEQIAATEKQLFTDDAFKLVNALRRDGAKNIRLDFNNTACHDEISWRVPESVFFTAFAAME